MTKFLLNAWSWSMARPKSMLVSKHELSEDEFSIQKEDAISCIGHPGLARLLDVPYNAEHIKLNVGDIALIVTTVNGKLDYNALELPEDIDLRFDCVKILEEI